MSKQVDSIFGATLLFGVMIAIWGLAFMPFVYLFGAKPPEFLSFLLGLIAATIHSLLLRPGTLRLRALGFRPQVIVDVKYATRFDFTVDLKSRSNSTTESDRTALAVELISRAAFVCHPDDSRTYYMQPLLSAFVDLLCQKSQTLSRESCRKLALDYADAIDLEEWGKGVRMDCCLWNNHLGHYHLWASTKPEPPLEQLVFLYFATACEAMLLQGQEGRRQMRAALLFVTEAWDAGHSFSDLYASKALAMAAVAKSRVAASGE